MSTEPKVESWCEEVLFANEHQYKNAAKYSGRAVDAEMHWKQVTHIFLQQL